MPSREEFESIISRLGGRTGTTVTGKTDCLIVGNDPGETKLESSRQKNIPMLFWTMALALGLFEERGGYRFTKIPEDLLAQVTLSLSTICEDIYVYALEGNTAFSLRDFYIARDALESLLCAAYGPSRRTIGAGDS